MWKLLFSITIYDITLFESYIYLNGVAILALQLEMSHKNVPSAMYRLKMPKYFLVYSSLQQKIIFRLLLDLEIHLKIYLKIMYDILALHYRLVDRHAPLSSLSPLWPLPPLWQLLPLWQWLPVKIVTFVTQFLIKAL